MAPGVARNGGERQTDEVLLTRDFLVAGRAPYRSAEEPDLPPRNKKNEGLSQEKQNKTNKANNKQEQWAQPSPHRALLLSGRPSQVQLSLQKWGLQVGLGLLRLMPSAVAQDQGSLGES